MLSDRAISPAVAAPLPRLRQQAGVIAVAVAVVLGLIVRLMPVLAADFPLNDGGMFYAMTRDLQMHGYRLPTFTSYNGAGIPFAYPPLGFYLTGLLDDATPLSLLDLFRLLPALLSLLTIGAFGLLSRAILPSPAAAGAATIAFALLPESFTWYIMGGGLTRALGLLLAVLALHQAYLLATRRAWGHLGWAALLVGGVILSHPVLALFTAVSIAVFFLAHGRSRLGLVQAALLALGALAVAAPWWGAILARHGPAPLLAARDHGVPAYQGVTGLLLLVITGEPYFPLLGSLALLGLLACLAGRRFFLPAWLAALFVVDPRSATMVAVVPLALLIGIGIVAVVLPLLQGDRPGEARPTTERAGPLAPSRLTVTALCFMVSYAIVSDGAPLRPYLTALSPDERAAMRWVAEATPTDSAFLVVSGDRWSVDRSAEWFPALAGRASITTVQGYEWRGDPPFVRRLARYDALQPCAASDSACLARWLERTGHAATHVYVPKRRAFAFGQSAAFLPDDCCEPLRASLRVDPGYTLLYDGPGASIFERVAT